MFFAYGRPWFVAAAYAVNRLSQVASKPARTIQPTHPELEYRLYDTAGIAYGEPLFVSHEFAAQRNRELAATGSPFRWMSQPPVAQPDLNPSRLPVYRLYDNSTGEFLEACLPMNKEVADEQNTNLSRAGSSFQWVHVG